MADQKITDLTANTTPALTNLSLMVDDPAGTPLTQKITLANLLSLLYPVGSIYINANVSTNPGTLLGFGTWTAFGVGRVLVSRDSGDTDFDVAEETGGAKTVASSAQSFAGTASTVIVNHTHPHNVQGGTTASTTGTNVMTSTATGGSARAMAIATANPTGGAANYTPAGTNTPGAATSVVQPYIVVYMWKRTA